MRWCVGVTIGWWCNGGGAVVFVMVWAAAWPVAVSYAVVGYIGMRWRMGHGIMVCQVPSGCGVAWVVLSGVILESRAILEPWSPDTLRYPASRSSVTRTRITDTRYLND